MSHLGQIADLAIVIIAAVVQILTDPCITRQFITNSPVALLI
jgi:hypothetical protein